MNSEGPAENCTPEGTTLEPTSTSDPTGPGMPSGPAETVLLSPSKKRWIQRESSQFQKSMMKDVALLLNYDKDIDLVEAFCSHDSMLTKVAQLSGMTAERWTLDDFDLATESGFAEAEYRLRELRPRRIWLSPECGPFSQMQNANQRTAIQKAQLTIKRKRVYTQ